MSFEDSYRTPILEHNHVTIVPGGLTIFTASIFIVGEMAGTGMLALASAMNQAGLKKKPEKNYIGNIVLNFSGWWGLFSTFLLCLLSGYCGIKLGECWTMLRQMSRAYCEGARSPFQIIATEGAGRFGKYLLIIVIYFQLLGAGVVFLLLAAQNLQSLFHAINVRILFCIWILIVAAFLIPFCWFGTPKDSWILAVIAMICTAIAALFITISALRDHRSHKPPSHVTFKTFSFSMGIMFFSWGGSAMFPTIQVDMRRPEQFYRAVLFAYAILLIFYLPIQIVGYTVYGGSINDNILTVLPKDFLRYSVEILITGHLLMAFTIVLNPIFQGFEDVVKTPKHFCWQRMALRSGLVLFLAFIAETIPHFGPILSFIGSSTVSILGFVLPVICYLVIKVRSTQLVNERQIDTMWRVIPLYELILLGLSLLVGLFGALASSFSSFSDLVNPNSYVLPCFINATSAEGPSQNATFY